MRVDGVDAGITGGTGSVLEKQMCLPLVVTDYSVTYCHIPTTFHIRVCMFVCVFVCVYTQAAEAHPEKDVLLLMHKSETQLQVHNTSLKSLRRQALAQTDHVPHHICVCVVVCVCMVGG